MASLTEALAAAFDYYAAGRFAEAAELGRRILAAAPDQAAAAQATGAAWAALGRLADATQAFRRFVILRPGDGGGWSNLGAAAASNDPDAALAHYHRASACDPGTTDIWANFAAVSFRLRNYHLAEATAQRGVASDPAHGAALVNLAEAELALSGATVWAARATRAAPSSGQARLTLAAALGRAGKAEEAVDAARAALTLGPALVGGWENLALAAAKLPSPAAVPVARAALARVEILRRKEPAALARTAASVLLTLAAPEEALPWLDVALAAAPDDAGLAWNRATALLQAGRWAEGWRAFEARRRDDKAEPPWRAFGVPAWDGGSFAGRRLLLYAEQGLGDAVQMLRFVPLAAALGGDVILELQRPLVAAAQRAFGDRAQVIGRGDPLPSFDLECPLFSLPGLFGATPEMVPGAPACLPPDPARAASRRSAFAGDGLKVGLVWAGNPRFPDDRRRSPGLGPFLPLLRAAPHVRFYVLQQGPGRADLGRFDLPANLIDPGPAADIDDTLALAAHLDLIVSSCTLPTHLALAAGVPTWVLLSHAPDWRWLLGRDDSPWSPAARLFRQPVPGDWATPVAAMAAALLAKTA